MKLIYKDGVQPSTTSDISVEAILTKDAINVANLLAINPEDIIQRDISCFNEPGLSQQRLQLRFQYYEEKRHLKLKAIENVLIKCQTNKNG